eukprot:COSAG01_NODE_14357_length_1464_cov_4.501832_1_plen_36_part_10
MGAVILFDRLFHPLVSAVVLPVFGVLNTRGGGGGGG